MKKRLCALARILVLFLSINLFLCINIVQCTKSLIDIINPILKENRIQIINLQEDVFFFKENVKFGDLAEFEKKKEYINDFVETLIKHLIFFKMEFEIDEASEEKRLFDNFGTINKAIIFNDIGTFLDIIKNENDKQLLFSLSELEKILQEAKREKEEIKLETEEEINIEENLNGMENKHSKKCYYVLTSLHDMKSVIKIVEEAVIKYKPVYFSYTITFYNTYNQHGVLLEKDDNPFAYAFNMKEIRGFKWLNCEKIIENENTDFFKNCYMLEQIRDVLPPEYDFLGKLVNNLILPCVDEKKISDITANEETDQSWNKSYRIHNIKIKRPKIKDPHVDF